MRSALPSQKFQNLPVFRSSDFFALCGANEGDAMSFASDLMLDDVYGLSRDASSQQLSVVRENGTYRIAAGSGVGTVGHSIHLDCAVTLMDDRNQVTEILVLVEVDRRSHARDVYLLPLAPLVPKTEYTLLNIDTRQAQQKLAQVACVSFTRGTRITLASGQQCRIEDLSCDDAVLTRDNGAQPVRWIGQSTQRAIGAFAPIRIAAGTLNNCNDLLVSPDHRLFVYQRSDHLGTGRAEVLVRARHLVNGSTVRVAEGGFVDYFQLLFDSHQIIFAEGIAAESMRIDDTTAPLLDQWALESLVPGAAHDLPLAAMDVGKDMLAGPDTVELLRRASRG